MNLKLLICRKLLILFVKKCGVCEEKSVNVDLL